VLRVRGPGRRLQTLTRTAWRNSKPTGGELARMPGKITGRFTGHSLRIYGWLLLQGRKALSSVKLALVYFDVASEARNCIR